MKKSIFTQLVSSFKGSIAVLALVLSAFVMNAQTYNFSTGAILDSPNFTDFTTAVAILPVAPPCPGSWVVSGVKLNVTHTWTSDLNIYLVAPGGATVYSLSTANGGNANNGYPSVTLSMDPASTATTIAGATPPSGSTFRAECLATDGTAVPANVFTGLTATVITQNVATSIPAATGTWTIRFRDTAGGDVGTVVTGTQLLFSYKPAGGALSAATIPTVSAATTAASPASAMLTLPYPTLTNSCSPSPTITYSVSPASNVVPASAASGTLPAAGLSLNLLLGNSSVTYNILDPVTGNTTSTTFAITVADGVPPVITSIPTNSTISLGAGQCNATYTFAPVTATDNGGFADNPSPNTPPINWGPNANVPYTGGNGNFGTAFNIKNRTNAPMLIEGFELNHAGLPTTFEVYVTKGNTYVGNLLTPSAWTSLGSQTVTQSSPVPAGAGAFVGALGIYKPNCLILAPGESKGIFVFAPTANSGYTNAAGAAANISENADIGVYTGNAVTGLLTGNIFGTVGPYDANGANTGTSRRWNGRVLYRKYTPDINNTQGTYSSNCATPTITNIGVTQTAGPVSGSAIPIGNTVYSFTAKDEAGNTATSSFTVTLTPFLGATTTIACQDLVNISLNALCTAKVGAEQILTGGPYQCFDNYQVTLSNGSTIVGTTTNGIYTGTPLSSFVGQMLTATVKDAVNPLNSCWGKVLIEDKLPPVITCPASLTVDCDAVTTPGVTTQVPFSASLAGTPATFATGVVPAQTLAIAGAPATATIKKARVSFNLTANDWFSDLTATLTHPDGTSIKLFQNVGNGTAAGAAVAAGTCTATGTYVFDIDDTGTIKLDNTIACGAATAAAITAGAKYKPSDNVNSLAFFNGKLVNGNYTIAITDNAAGFGSTVINNLTLEILTDIPFPGATAVDACGGAVSVKSTDATQNFTCTQNANFSKVITRSFVATDLSGNTAKCSFNITIKRAKLTDVTFPIDRDGVDSPMLDCSYPAAGSIPAIYGLGTAFAGPYFDANGNPSPSVTGSPKPSGGGCNNVSVAYTDTRFNDVCGANGYKIVRTWKVVDWCAGTSSSKDQIIKVGDMIAPVITDVPVQQFASTTGNSCSGTLTLATPTVKDNCSKVTVTATIFTDLTLTTAVGSVDATNGLKFSDVPKSEFGPDELPIPYIVVYTAIDECGNAATAQGTLVVLDLVPPTVVCNPLIKISLTADGTATINANIFDAGTKDNCKLAKMHVKRLGDYNSCSKLDVNKDGDTQDYVGLGQNGQTFAVALRWNGKIDTVLATTAANRTFTVANGIVKQGTMVPISPLDTTVTWYNPLPLAGFNNPAVTFYGGKQGTLVPTLPIPFLTFSAPANVNAAMLIWPGVAKANCLRIKPNIYGGNTQYPIIYTSVYPYYAKVLSTFYKPNPGPSQYLGVDANENGLADDDNYYEYEYYNYFHKDVKFCCEDIGNDTLMVAVKAWDEVYNFLNYNPDIMDLLADPDDDTKAYTDYLIPRTGNANVCMTRVIIEDKLPPVIFAKDNMVVCSNNADAKAWLNANKPQLKSLADYPTKNNPGYLDNCDVTITSTDEEAIDNCGAGKGTPIVVSPGISFSTGAVTRTWTATDKGGRKATATQTYMSVNMSAYEVEFPADKLDYTCTNQGSTDPKTTGEPKITNKGGSCPLVGVEYTDEIFDVVPGACYKILRTWKIINWCQVNSSAGANNLGKGRGTGCTAARTYSNVDPATIATAALTDTGNPAFKFKTTAAAILATVCGGYDSDGYMEYTQVIKVSDNDAPVLVPGTVTVAPKGKDCAVDVTVKQGSATDCTKVTELSVAIYKVGAGGSETLVDTYVFGADKTWTFDINSSAGNYIARYKANDKCGNFSTANVPFVVKDVKKPTPVCHYAVSAEIMPTAGTVMLMATQFNNGSYDNCTASNNLKFTIESPATAGAGATTVATETFVTLACKGTKAIRLWVTDEAGNSDYCEAVVDLQVNMPLAAGITVPACATSTTASVAVEIKTELDKSVEGVMLKLDGNTNSQSYTPPSGLFSFLGLTPNANYTVTPELNSDQLNGVTTYDLVLISKHILNIQPFNTPYKWIAADINKSGTVTTFDMVELRKMILHINNSFPVNTSWRFVDKSYVFPTVGNPLTQTFPEAKNYQSLSADEKADFIGVKVGDINGNVKASSKDAVSDRAKGSINVTVDEAAIVAGNEVKVTFKASDISSIEGYQFTMNYDKSALELVTIEGDKANFGIIEAGTITTSWNGSTKEEALFSLVFKAKKDGQLSKLITLNSRVTKAEAYTNAADLMDIALQFNGANKAADKFELYQNSPNPFKGTTVIGFNLPSAQNAKMTIYDMTGRTLRVIDGNFAKGYNEVNISDINATGVLQYKLETASDVATKSMIIIE